MAGTRKQTISVNRAYVKNMMNRKNVGLACYTMGLSVLAAENSRYTQDMILAQDSLDLDRDFTIEEYTKHYWVTKIMSGLKKLLEDELTLLDVPFEVGGDESRIVEENGNIKAKIGSNFIEKFEKSTNPNVIKQINPGEISCALYDKTTGNIVAIFIIKCALFYEYENIFDIKNISPIVKIILYAKNSQVKGKNLGTTYFKIISQIFRKIIFTKEAEIDKIAIKIYKELYPNNYRSLVKSTQIDKFVFSAAGNFARDFWEKQGAKSTNIYDSQILNTQKSNENMYPMVLDLATQPQEYEEVSPQASHEAFASQSRSLEAPFFQEPYIGRFGNQVLPYGYIDKKTRLLQESINNMNYGGSKYTRKIKRPRK